MEATFSPSKAKQLILEKSAPAGMVVAGSLEFANDLALTWLPDDLQVRRLTLNNCRSLVELPRNLRCYELEMQNTTVRALPDDLVVEYRLDLTGNRKIETLPAGLKVGTLVLANCRGLTALPENLDVNFLDISGCINLRSFPKHGAIKFGRLTAQNCTQLTYLPDWITSLSQLDLRGCSSILSLPEHLHVSGWIDIAGTGIQELPPKLQGVQLRWRGVRINEQIAFKPESFSAHDVLATVNMELRRVLLERVGYERFVSEAAAEEIDRDFDMGGVRRLLRIQIPRDEALVCVTYHCPSTQRLYVTRVPPNMQTCHQAVAWIAGFDNPDDYKLIAEA